MTVQATVDSTLNGQTAEFTLIEESPRGARSHETATLSGGTEEFIFTELDGGRDKTYYPKVQLETSDVTQTAQVPYGMEVQIDPIPHRDAGASGHVREGANFTQGVGARELGLGDNALVGGLLTTALNDGEVLADDGYVYSSVQAAQDAASSWIFIGPGTFSGDNTIDTAGLTVTGVGTIDTSSDIGFEVTASDVTIRNISFNGAERGIYTPTPGTSDNLSISNVHADGCSICSIPEQNNPTVVNSTSINTNGSGVYIRDDSGTYSGAIVSGCTVRDANSLGIWVGLDDSIISNNTIDTTEDTGISLYLASDEIVIGNRVHNALDVGIAIQANDNIVANNRVSDTRGLANDINDNGTGTVLDGNLTGSAN